MPIIVLIIVRNPSNEAASLISFFSREKIYHPVGKFFFSKWAETRDIMKISNSLNVKNIHLHYEKDIKRNCNKYYCFFLKDILISVRAPRVTPFSSYACTRITRDSRSY